jgi:DNA-binding IclR family transcriptional regulator
MTSDLGFLASNKYTFDIRVFFWESLFRNTGVLCDFYPVVVTMSSNTKVERVKTADMVFEVIETLIKHDGIRVTTLANEMDIAKSTAHRYLATLEDLKYLDKEGEVYRVGVKFLQVGEYARARDPAYPMAKKKVIELAEETSERAQFLIEAHGKAAYIHREYGEQGIKTGNDIGDWVPLHSTAAGKAILSEYPDERVDEIIEQHGLEQLTPATITDRDALFDELEMIREKGYSTNNQENIDGLRAIGAPIKGPNGSVVGSISVSGPTHRIKGEWFNSELPQLLLGAKNELELNIAHS